MICAARRCDSFEEFTVAFAVAPNTITIAPVYVKLLRYASAPKAKEAGHTTLARLLTLPIELHKDRHVFFVSGFAFDFAAGFASGVPMCRRAIHFPLRFAQTVLCRSGPMFGAVGGVTV